MNVTVWNIQEVSLLDFAPNSQKFHWYYLDTAEFQMNTWIIKSLKLLVYAVLAKVSYFFNLFPRAFYCVWKKAVITHIRHGNINILYLYVSELKKSSGMVFWVVGWYFAISTAVFGNVINSSVSSKGDARNIVRFKEDLNKKMLLTRTFLLYYM